MITQKIKWEYPLKETNVMDEIKILAQKTGLTELETAILYNRNIKTPKDIMYFMESSPKNFHDTRLMKDSLKAVERIIQAKEKGEFVVNWTDYDADGWGSNVALKKILNLVGIDVFGFVNDRSAGYGIYKDGIDELLISHPQTKLIICTDNGIVAFDAIDYAQSKGIDVVVLDHHEPAEDGRIPNAYAVVDPKRLDCEYPFKGLCAAGVVLKIGMLLLEELGMDKNLCLNYIDVVATSTIGDVVPLVDENRIIVKEGLKLINSETKNIWRIMRETLLNKTSKVDAEAIAWYYTPAINACSRILGNVQIPMDMFALDDSNEEEILKTCLRMKTVNEERRRRSTEMEAIAQSMAVELNEDFNVLVLKSEEFEEGINGIIAGRIKDKFLKPAIVLSVEKDSGHLRGSARSVEGFPLKDILDEIKNEKGEDFFIKYGGHEMAAGLTISEKNYIELMMTLDEKMNKFLETNDVSRKVKIDFAVNSSDMSIKVIDILNSMAPFGNGFEKPIIGIKGFKPKVSKIKDVHLKMEDSKTEVIIWNASVLEDEVNEQLKDKEVYIIGYPKEISTFNNKISFQLDGRKEEDKMFIRFK